MVSLFLLLGCNLSYIVDLFAALCELASASASTLRKLASSVRVLLKPYGDTLRAKAGVPKTIAKRKLRLHFLYLLQNTLMLTASCGEFSDLHSIFRLCALRY